MKKRIVTIITICSIWGLGISTVFALPVTPTPRAPSFDKDIGGPMTNSEEEGAKVWNPDGGAVKGNQTLQENLKAIIQPKTTEDGGFMGRVLRNIALAAIILYLVIAGAKLVVSGNKSDDLKTAVKNLGFIALGAIFIYGAGRIFGESRVIDFTP